MNYKRVISPSFLESLRSGVLQPIMVRIQEDDTLTLALRRDYINIYYRGGNLLKISEVPQKSGPAIYAPYFNMNYRTGDSPCDLDFPGQISDSGSSKRLVDKLPTLKYFMDRFFALMRDKSEREFQQLVVRENNRSGVSHETDYFIIDIEAAGIAAGAQFDMLGVRWQDRRRAGSGTLIPVLVEMKYGNQALTGTSGLREHLDQMRSLMENADTWNNVVQGLQSQLDQLVQLDLLRFNHSSRNDSLRIDQSAKPELVFVLANYNPASTKLLTFLEQVDQALVQHTKFDLRFHASCFSGYGMYRASMLTFGEFKDHVTRLHDAATAKISLR
jgi:hypothetical protein